MTEAPRIRPIINAGGKQFYRVGPIYCNEVRGDVAISYEVDDVADWDRKRAEAMLYATTLELKRRAILTAVGDVSEDRDLPIGSPEIGYYDPKTKTWSE